MTEKKDELFNDNNQVKNTYIKWGKFGDFVKGTLTRKWQLKSNFPGKENTLVWNYEILVDAGSFHNIDENEKVAETPTVLTAGDFIKVGGRASIDDAMRNIKVGQIVGLRYTADGKKKPGKKPAKIVKVYRGEMNTEYMGQTSTDQIQEVFPDAEEVK